MTSDVQNRTQAKTVVPVRVFSDYTCPWCFIGSERLKQLRDSLPDSV
ncbi:MAG: DsbA family protein, partial [Myxococcota bacterium]